MKIGKTIVSEREKVVSESERFKMREKETKRKKMTTAIFFAVIILIGISIFAVAKGIIDQQKKELALNTNVDTKKYVPTITIENDDGSKYTTEKMKTYVGKIEQDFQDLGYKVIRAIVPAGKTREIDIYIEGRNEFYKTHLDRNPAETAEDAVRMFSYLDKNEIVPAYVDIRVSGRAYWK